MKLVNKSRTFVSSEYFEYKSIWQSTKSDYYLRETAWPGGLGCWI